MFRTVADQFVGQVSLFKVLSGTVAVDDRLVNTTSGTEERLHGLFHLRGKEHLTADKVVAGDLAAVAKLTDTADRLDAGAEGLARCGSSPPRRPDAVVRPGAPAAHAVRRRQALRRRCNGCWPRTRRSSSSATRRPARPCCAARGDTHLAVALERLARKFGVNVETEDVRVPYRETIIGSAEAEGKIKKQSGGHGQYAVAHLRVSPMARGDGTEFVNSIVGGTIPKQYIPAVQRGVEETMATGGVHGFPVVDVRVECYDGKYHSVDSSDMAFRSAAAHGLKEALQKAGAAVLEPISLLTVTVPEGYQGDVLGDLNARRGRVSGTSVLGNGAHEIVALVPAAEIQRYAVELRSMTGGRGTFVAVHDHYDLLPPHLTDKIKQTPPNGH